MATSSCEILLLDYVMNLCSDTCERSCTDPKSVIHNKLYTKMLHVHADTRHTTHTDSGTRGRTELCATLLQQGKHTAEWHIRLKFVCGQRSSCIFENLSGASET